MTAAGSTGSRSPSLASSQSATVEAPSRGQRILIVDDDVNLTRLLRAILQSAGFNVVTASDGEQALRLVDADGAPAAIILDLLMPGMDGRTFYRELKARGLHVPVLIASAFGARAAQAELGAHGAIEKPFDPEELVEAVTQLISDESAP